MAVDAPPLRFVVLYHEGIPQPHFDLMFERASGGPLATWRSPHWPLLPGDVAVRIADHRAAYLEYEGDLTEDRGRVRRIAHGVYLRAQNATHWKIEFIDPELLPIELKA